MIIYDENVYEHFVFFTFSSVWGPFSYGASLPSVYHNSTYQTEPEFVYNAKEQVARLCPAAMKMM